MVRRFAACIAFACAATAASAGCTFLIGFDDQPSCDGGLCRGEAGVGPDAPAPVGDAAADAPRSDDGNTDPPRDAGADTYDVCNGKASGYYCATDGLKGWAGSPEDLIICANNQVAEATLCDGGCISMPDPFPDTCSGCPDKPDGVYCGRDFPSFPHIDGGDDDFLIACQSGNVTTTYPCPHGCKSEGAASSCYP